MENTMKRSSRHIFVSSQFHSNSPLRRSPAPFAAFQLTLKCEANNITFHEFASRNRSVTLPDDGRPRVVAGKTFWVQMGEDAERFLMPRTGSVVM
jgi:hypothetical protein